MACRSAILALLAATHINALPSPQTQSPIPATYDMPLTHNQFGFLTNISIGTPPQQIVAFVDWTWIGQYVITPKCNGSLTATSDCFPEGQKFFQPASSSTFKNASYYAAERTWNPNHFFFYDDLTIEFAFDVETVGLSSSEIMIQPADFGFQLPEAFPFTGVYGLSPVFPSDNLSTSSPYWQAWKNGAWQSPQFGFHYCYPGSPDNKTTCGGADGLQNMGAINPALIKGEMTWYDNILWPEVNVQDFIYDPVLLNYWALNLTRFAIGDEDQPINYTGAGAIFDHASYGRGAPMSVDAYAKLVALAGGQPITLTEETAPNNGNQSFFSVDCEKSKAELPNLQYEFNDVQRTWEVEPKSYVKDIGNGTCVLDVRTLGYGDMLTGNFGETFSQDKYIAFDFEKLQVGIADVEWGV